MERLILLRHGKAEPDSATGDDFDRRLAPGGVEDSVAMGHRLADMGFHPDKALVSAAARTCETWEAAAPAFPFIEVDVREDLYNAEADHILASAKGVGLGECTVMMVGHNPGIQELAVRLLIEGGAPAGVVQKAASRFPPASAVVFLIDPKGKPVFDGLFYPD